MKRPLANLRWFVLALAGAFACVGAVVPATAQDARVITNADLPRQSSVSVVGTLQIDGAPSAERDMPVVPDRPQPQRARRAADDSKTWSSPSVLTISGDRRSLADGWQPPGAGLSRDSSRTTRVLAYVLTPVSAQDR